MTTGPMPVTGPSSAARRPRPSTRAVVALAKAAGSLSRALGVGGGGTVPGRVALALLTDPLRKLSYGRSVVLVSGTNGKTTTTRLLAAALATGGPVLTNADGDNLVAGLTSTLAAGLGRPGRAVLEVDEVALPTAVSQLRPEVLLLMNLSRDQLDRTGEVAAHVTRWTLMLRGSPATTVVANADDPLVVSAVLRARPDAAQVVWVAAGQPWRADCPRCPNCGAAWASPDPATPWACSRCDFARPAPSWSAGNGEVRAPGRPPLAARLSLPGRANVANAAMAAAAASELGIDVETALTAMRSVGDVGGRYQRSQVGQSVVHLLLAKNPAGWAEVLDQLSVGDGPVVIVINAHAADGTDPSWLWDVPFERLRGRRVVASGERAADLAVRLLYAEVEHALEPDPLAGVALLGAPTCEIAANYTAFTRIRDRLGSGTAASPVPAA